MIKNRADYEGYLYRSWGSLNSLLWSYPIVDYVSLYRLKLLKEFLGKVEGKTVIDIGCGNGSISLLLWLLGAEVYSIDSSMEALQVTRSLKDFREKMILEMLHLITRSSGIGESIPTFRPNLCQSDAMRLPYRKDTFDIACCLETLEFVKNDMPAILEIERVTKPGGKVILFIPYDSKETNEEIRSGHYRRYSLKSIKEKILSGQLRLNQLIFWYFPMLLLLDLIRMRYFCAALGLWLEALNGKSKHCKSQNLRNRETFIYSLTRFYRTKLWLKAALPLLLRVLDINKCFQNLHYINIRKRTNDVFLILKKAG